jgi:hypothetical protein
MDCCIVNVEKMAGQGDKITNARTGQTFGRLMGYHSNYGFESK